MLSKSTDIKFIHEKNTLENNNTETIIPYITQRIDKLKNRYNGTINYTIVQ